MSIEAMNAVWKYSRAKATPLLVLLSLADFADDSWECWPSVSTIARKCRLADERHVKRIIHEELEDRLGEVVVIRNEGRSSSKGGLRSNRYRIVVHMPEEDPIVVEGPPSAANDGGSGTTQIVADGPPLIVVEGPPESSFESSCEPPTLATASPSPVENRSEDVLEALLDVCGWEPSSLTSSAQGQANKAVKELRGVAATVDEIRNRARRYHHKFPQATLTPSALVKHWPALAGGGERFVQPDWVDYVPPRTTEEEFVQSGRERAHKAESTFRDLLRAKTTDPEYVAAAERGRAEVLSPSRQSWRRDLHP